MDPALTPEEQRAAKLALRRHALAARDVVPDRDRREAVTVPASAILSDDQGDRVQVVRDGKVDSRPVRAGVVWQQRREILEGLTEGETVIARAGAFFLSGDRVRAAP